MGHVGATGKTPRPVASPCCHLVGLGGTKSAPNPSFVCFIMPMILTIMIFLATFHRAPVGWFRGRTSDLARGGGLSGLGGGGWLLRF